MLKKFIAAIMILSSMQLYAQTPEVKSDSYRMKAFIDALMKKMTLEEKDRAVEFTRCR